MGSLRSKRCLVVTKEIWEFVLLHGSMITAQHIPGKLNTIADSESLIFKDSSNWKLCPQVFQGLQKMFPWIEVDLFADRLNHQVPRFWNWRPDPLAEGVHALTVVWREMRAYAFPPIKWIHRVLWKVHNEGATLLLVAPVWCQQPWYPMLLRMLIEQPVLIPSSHLLLTASDGAPHPMCLNQRLVLASLRGSGKGPELSADARDLVDKARSSGTTRAYKSGWKKFSSWCDQRQANPFSCPVEIVVNFLAAQQRLVLFGKLAGYRSTISHFHEKVDGMPVGKHPLVVEVMKGSFRDNPPVPRFTLTWDINIVLTYL